MAVGNDDGGRGRTPAASRESWGERSVYSLLRREILDGVLKPGARLKTGDLRARHGASAAAVREALLRLRGEALVAAEGRRGFRVAAASIEDFRDLIQARMLLETEALRQAIALGGEAWESEIVAAYYRLSKAEQRLAEQPDCALDEFEARNRDFHLALLAACPSRWLRRTVGVLSQHCERYRRGIVTVPRASDRDRRGEHKAILEAVLARNAELACRLLREHARGALVWLQKTLDETGDRTPGAGA